MPTLPKFEFPTFEFPKFDLSNLDPSKIDWSKIELPKFDLPKFDMPKVDLPDVDLPSPEQVLAVLRDAAYAGTGLVALTAERVAELQSALQAKFVEVLKAQLAQAAAIAKPVVDTAKSVVSR